MSYNINVTKTTTGTFQASTFQYSNGFESSPPTDDKSTSTSMLLSTSQQGTQVYSSSRLAKVVAIHRIPFYTSTHVLHSLIYCQKSILLLLGEVIVSIANDLLIFRRFIIEACLAPSNIVQSLIHIATTGTHINFPAFQADMPRQNHIALHAKSHVIVFALSVILSWSTSTIHPATIVASTALETFANSDWIHSNHCRDTLHCASFCHYLAMTLAFELLKRCKLIFHLLDFFFICIHLVKQC